MASSFNPYAKENPTLFSDTEKDIARLICEEKTSEEIGKILFLSKRVVETTRAKMLAKINAKTPIGLVIYAIKNGIYTSDY